MRAAVPWHQGELRVAPVCELGDRLEALHKHAAVVPVARDESGPQSAGRSFGLPLLPF